jgi:hypothetical protein
MEQQKRITKKCPSLLKSLTAKKAYFRIATKWFPPGLAQMPSLTFASKISLL